MRLQTKHPQRGGVRYQIVTRAAKEFALDLGRSADVVAESGVVIPGVAVLDFGSIRERPERRGSGKDLSASPLRKSGIRESGRGNEPAMRAMTSWIKKLDVRARRLSRTSAFFADAPSFDLP
jgi:hypothetical protein